MEAFKPLPDLVIIITIHAWLFSAMSVQPIDRERQWAMTWRIFIPIAPITVID